MVKNIMRIAIAALVLELASCGPGDGEADVHVSVPGDSTTPDTVVTTNTVVEHQTDTVVQPGTVVQQTRTDTIVKTVPGNTTTVPSTPATTVSADERRAIDTWLAAHADSLNQYGDPKDMAYTGGTPLFNESSGQSISKYDYIVRQHPDKPWMQNVPVQAQPRR
jgi:hypothetical protein